MIATTALHALYRLVENWDGKVRFDEDPVTDREMFAAKVLAAVADLIIDDPRLKTRENLGLVTELVFTTLLALGMPVSPPTAPDVPRTLQGLSRLEAIIHQYLPHAEIAVPFDIRAGL